MSYFCQKCKKIGGSPTSFRRYDIWKATLILKNRSSLRDMAPMSVCLKYCKWISRTEFSTPNFIWEGLLKKIQQYQFPLLQPVAGTREVRSDVSMPLQSMYDLTSPAQTNDGTNQIDHDTEVYVPYSFSNNVMGSFTSPSNWYVRMKETRPTA